MKKITAVVIVTLFIGISIPFFVGDTASAIDIFGGSCDRQPDNPVCDSSGSGGDNVMTLIGNVINALLYLIGIVAVVMIIIGGFRYVVAQGDSGQLSSAKNTIMYAVIGLVVAVAAFAIVNFVLDRI